MPATRHPAAKPHRAAAKTASSTSKHRWSAHVNETSDAMDLKHDLFKQADPKAIARSLKSSAEHSDRRKSEPYRSAMSMLTFYINRAGKNLPDKQVKVLEKAKSELRALFGRAEPKPQASRQAAASR